MKHEVPKEFTFLRGGRGGNVPWSAEKKEELCTFARDKMDATKSKQSGLVLVSLSAEKQAKDTNDSWGVDTTQCDGPEEDQSSVPTSRSYLFTDKHAEYCRFAFRFITTDRIWPQIRHQTKWHMLMLSLCEFSFVFHAASIYSVWSRFHCVTWQCSFFDWFSGNAIIYEYV